MIRYRLTTLDIITITAARYGLTRDALLSRTRRLDIMRPRQIAIYVARRLTDCSTTKLAERFRMKDHTTIVWAYHRIPELMQQQPDLAFEVREIERECLALAARRSGSGGGQAGAVAPTQGMAA